MVSLKVTLVFALVAVLVYIDKSQLCLPPTTLSSPWPLSGAVGVVGMTAAQRSWYQRQGFPIPVANRFALGYQNFHGVGKFKVHRAGRSWNDALDVCAKEGSILAVINDATEAEILKSLIIGAPNELVASGMYYYWVGAKELGKNMQFQTLQGEILGNFNYLSWSPSNSQPDNYGNFDCVGFMHDGTNFDADCNERLGFICEKVT